MVYQRRVVQCFFKFDELALRLALVRTSLCAHSQT